MSAPFNGGADDGIFRNFVTSGVPSSGIHKPDKAEVRAWLSWVEETFTEALVSDLPPLAGHALKYMRVNAGETAAEFTELPSADVGVEGIAELATSADAINAVESSKIMTAYRTRQAIDAHPLTVRAFVNFDMNSGVPIIASSQGVASVSQSSSGVYQINWDSAFTSAGYAVVCTMEGNSDNTRYPNIRGIDASYVRVGNGNDNGKNPVCVVALGELA